jgi:hypothetical protein
VTPRLLCKLNHANPYRRFVDIPLHVLRETQEVIGGCTALRRASAPTARRRSLAGRTSAARARHRDGRPSPVKNFRHRRTVRSCQQPPFTPHLMPFTACCRPPWREGVRPVRDVARSMPEGKGHDDPGRRQRKIPQARKGRTMTRDMNTVAGLIIACLAAEGVESLGRVTGADAATTASTWLRSVSSVRSASPSASRAEDKKKGTRA